MHFYPAIISNLSQAEQKFSSLDPVPLDKPPYYGLVVYPGDLGTKGGLRTDVSARVLTKDGAPLDIDERAEPAAEERATTAEPAAPKNKARARAPRNRKSAKD